MGFIDIVVYSDIKCIGKTYFVFHWRKKIIQVWNHTKSELLL